MMAIRSVGGRLIVGALAALLVAGGALAADFVGVIKKVDVEERTVVVTDQDTDEDVDVKVDDDSIFVTLKGDEKHAVKELEKLKKGWKVEVEHKKGLASKIIHKKGEPKDDDPEKDGPKKKKKP